MIEQLFKVCESKAGIGISLGYNSVSDYVIQITHNGECIVLEQGCDLLKIAATGYVKITEYMSEHLGGY